MDAITLLREDHKAVEKVFKSFEKAGDNAHATKRRLVDTMVADLSVHAAIEEQEFYPAVRREVSGTVAEVLEALEEHHVVKWLLSELEDLDPADERFDAKVTVLIESVRHHVREEEGELFPQVRAALGRKRLAEIGEGLAAAKRVASAHPHPRGPDTPPGNVLVGTVTGAVDRARDAIRKGIPTA